jgi:hypothetical protein
VLEVREAAINADRVLHSDDEIVYHILRRELDVHARAAAHIRSEPILIAPRSASNR